VGKGNFEWGVDTDNAGGQWMMRCAEGILDAAKEINNCGR
jgi:hypothetical protein